MNAKVIEAIKGIRDNLNIILEEMDNVSVDTVAEEVAPKNEAPVAESKPEETKTTMSRKEREASEELPDTSEIPTREQLDGLSYNNLKRLAKEMGIPATGAREELTQKILNYEGEVPNTEAEEPEVQEEAPAKKSTGKIVQIPVAVEEDEEEEEDDEEDILVAKVNEAVEDMTNEEIADVLADVGVRAKGKRQSLISAVIQAVKDGKIDLDGDDEEDEDEEVEEESTTSTETAESEGEEAEEFDVNDSNNPDMTEARSASIEAYSAEVRNDFDNDEITREQIVEWLNEYHNTKDSMKKKSDDDIVEEYIYCSCLFIDDEGEFIEDEGAYTVNGIPYCCGHELAYNEDNSTYICEICGAEYEAGEE